MKGSASLVCGAVLLALFCASCSQREQSDTDARAEAAKERIETAASETRVAIEQLANRVKQKSNRLVADIDSALKDGYAYGGRTSDTVRTAGDRARHAGERLKTDADQVTLKAQVKSKLANEVGLNTITALDVDATGQAVTLSGVVPTLDDKHRAEAAVASMPEVQHVVDNLEVRSR
jgi:osmotically-inducible protein OsmY